MLVPPRILREMGNYVSVCEVPVPIAPLESECALNAKLFHPLAEPLFPDIIA